MFEPRARVRLLQSDESAVWSEVFVLVAVLGAATAFGVFRRLTDGRLRRQAALTERLTAAELGGGLGARATVVQFSTPFCQVCRPTRAMLRDLTGELPGRGLPRGVGRGAAAAGAAARSAADSGGPGTRRRREHRVPGERAAEPCERPARRERHPAQRRIVPTRSQCVTGCDQLGAKLGRSCIQS